MDGEHADDLLKRALIDAEAAASVALRVTPLSLSEQLTVVFHGRKDLGTIQTYVAHGGRGAGEAVGKDELMRVPLRPRPRRRRGSRGGRAPVRRTGRRAARRPGRRRHRPRHLARAARGPRRTTTSASTAGIKLDLRLPAHRLLPTALVSPEKQIVVTAVCSARPLAEGRPPMGIAVAQQDVVRVYPLPGRPRALPRGLPRSSPPSTPASSPSSSGRQEASVQRFLELSGDDFHQTG